MKLLVRWYDQIRMLKEPAMQDHAAEPKRLYRQVAGELRALISRDGFVAGSRLPPERQLALALKVSRPSVREALIALEVEGWIEVRKGSGIYVRDRSRDDAGAAAETAQANAPGPLELLRARALVEGEVAALAAGMANRAQIAGLEEAVRQMEAEAAGGAVPLHGDRLFHLRLARITRNSTLVRVVAELFDQRSNPLSSRLGEHLEHGASWRSAVREHRQVILALKCRDPVAAREAMQRHMALSHRRLSVRLD
ncbi:MAG: transcriptional regulator, GntR-family [Burkholderia sp.]|nr:transcriptional regulator, GntR-family [Burkholderia sp.]